MPKCVACKQDKPIDGFYVRKESGRHRTDCKVCHAERGKRWVMMNPEKRRAISLRWGKAHYPYIRMKKAEYRRTKPEMMNKWNREHPTEKKAMNAKWARENRGRVTANVRKRQAIRLKATPPWADLSAIQAIYIEAARTGKHVDHIIPLQHPRVCGLHVESNLQLLSPHENYVKRNRWPYAI